MIKITKKAALPKKQEAVILRDRIETAAEDEALENSRVH